MSKRTKDESSFTDEIGEFLYYACCCFMCPCRVTSPCSKCCDCCPCCWYNKHYESLERENEELLLPREPDYGSGDLHPSPYKVEVVSKQPRSKPSPQEDGSQDDLPPDHDRAALLKSAGSDEQQSTPPKTETDVLDESSESRRLHFTDEDEEQEINTEKEEVKEELDTGREEVKEETDTGVSATLSWGDFGEEDEEEEDSEMAAVSGQKGTSDSQRVPDEGKDPIESVKVKRTPTPDGVEEGKSPSRVILSIAPTPTKESKDNDDYSSSEEYFAPAVSTKDSQQEEEEEFIDDRSILFEWRSAGKKVAVTGDFNEWTEEPMKKSSDGVFRYQTKLKVGRYLYRFKVDKKWTVDDERPVISKGEGRDNTYNVVDVK